MFNPSQPAESAKIVLAYDTQLICILQKKIINIFCV